MNIIMDIIDIAPSCSQVGRRGAPGPVLASKCWHQSAGSNDNSSNDGSGDEDAGGDAAAGEDAGDGGNPQAITATQVQRAMLKEQRETNRLNRLLANLHMHHLVLPHQAQRGADLAA